MIYQTDCIYVAEYLREMTHDELVELLTSARATLTTMNLAVTRIGRIKVPAKPHLFGKLRRDIARIRTILKEGHYAAV